MHDRTRADGMRLDILKTFGQPSETDVSRVCRRVRKCRRSFSLPFLAQAAGHVSGLDERSMAGQEMNAKIQMMTMSRTGISMVALHQGERPAFRAIFADIHAGNPKRRKRYKSIRTSWSPSPNITVSPEIDLGLDRRPSTA